jgi:hypothetical protein
LTVNKVTLTIIANNGSKTYGSDKSYSGSEFTVSGTLYNGDAVTSVSLSSAGDPATAAQGSYPIVASAASGSGLSNYNITYTDGTLTVDKAILTLTADNKTKVYDGVVFSQFTVTYSGFANSETSAVLGGTLSFAGSATTAKNAGTGYVIVPGGLTSTNYIINFVDGTLDIAKATVTPLVTAKDKCFDNNNSATVSSQTLTGVLPPDIVNLEVNAAGFSDATAGTGKTVTATGLSLSGNDAGNYILSATTATTIANIYILPIPIITGDTSPCEETSGVTYSTEPGMSGYTWTISAGGTITSGAGTNTIIVTWLSVGEQTVNVNYTNASGCQGKTATTSDVTVNQKPIIGSFN